MRFSEEAGSGKEIRNLYDETEGLYQKLWKQYFSSVNISARKNLKLHIQHMPRRYWKYLPEKAPLPGRRWYLGDYLRFTIILRKGFWKVFILLYIMWALNVYMVKIHVCIRGFLHLSAPSILLVLSPSPKKKGPSEEGPWSRYLVTFLQEKEAWPSLYVSKLQFFFGRKPWIQYSLVRGKPINVFPNKPSTEGRASLHRRLEEIKKYRNRINHCEPLCFNGNIINCAEASAIHRKLYDLISWIDPNLIPYFNGIDKVPIAIGLISRIWPCC